MLEARFQTFDDPNERAATPGRLAALRAELKRRDLAGFVGTIVSVDRFGNLVTSFERAHWDATRGPRMEAGRFASSKLSSRWSVYSRTALTTALVFGSRAMSETGGLSKLTLRYFAGSVLLTPRRRADPSAVACAGVTPAFRRASP